jgi:hypothetical protein
LMILVCQNSKFKEQSSKVESKRRNFRPFDDFSKNTSYTHRRRRSDICSLDFELWYLIIFKKKSPFRAFCFNDALPLPHARGRGQVRLE